MTKKANEFEGIDFRRPRVGADPCACPDSAQSPEKPDGRPYISGTTEDQTVASVKSKNNKHRRRSIRLKEYDYAQSGAYFITICTQNRECLFGSVVENEMRSTPVGDMVYTVWNELPQFYSGVAIDQFIVMPNHVHGVILLVGAGPRACPDSAQSPEEEPDETGHPQGGAPTLSLSGVVHRFKSFTTARFRKAGVNDDFGVSSKRLWQRNYYEHIIRNEKELRLVREYIVNNPLQWALDRENPGNKNPKEIMVEPWLF